MEATAARMDADTVRSRLMWAIAHDDVQLAKSLLEAGADLGAHDGRDGEAPLSKAGRYESEAMIHMLLDHGADPSAPWAVGFNQSVEGWVRLWSDKGADAIDTWKAQQLEKRLTTAWGENAALRGQRDALKGALGNVLDSGPTPTAPTVARVRV